MPEPSFVTAETPTTVTFTAQNERPRSATVTLELTPPLDVELAPEAAPPGWSADVRGRSIRWSGGRIEGAGFTSFPARVTAGLPPGSYVFRAVQRYEDGGTVRWDSAFTVLPGSGDATPDQHLGRAIVAGVVGLAVVAASLLGLGVLRRRRAA